MNPRLKEKGFLMLFSPLDKVITRTIKVPLYYTGLTTKAIIREKDSQQIAYTLDNRREIKVNVTIPANGFTWFVIE